MYLAIIGFHIAIHMGGGQSHFRQMCPATSCNGKTVVSGSLNRSQNPTRSVLWVICQPKIVLGALHVRTSHVHSALNRCCRLSRCMPDNLSTHTIASASTQLVQMDSASVFRACAVKDAMKVRGRVLIAVCVKPVSPASPDTARCAASVVRVSSQTGWQVAFHVSTVAHWLVHSFLRTVLCAFPV